jgi:hypothetical protein
MIDRSVVTRTSLRCMVNIRRMREELNIQLEASDLAPDSNSPFISRAAVEAILNSAEQSALKTALQSVLDSRGQLILKAAIEEILDSTLESLIEVATELPDTRPIDPVRPELIYQRYLAEKEAWLTANPDVRPSSYRKKRALNLIVSRTVKSRRGFFL